jgi:hypothetical protein
MRLGELNLDHGETLLVVVERLRIALPRVERRAQREQQVREKYVVLSRAEVRGAGKQREELTTRSASLN